MLDLAIPVEALGKARAFHARVAAENAAYLAASQRMIQPIHARIMRFPLRNFRPEVLRDFEHQWREHMPQEFSIDLVTEWPRHGVTITEHRLGIAEFHDDGWRKGYQEAEVSIGTVTVTLNRMTATVTFRTRAIVNRHALARHYQWSWDSGDAALIRDIVALGGFDAGAIQEGEYVTVPVGDGAGWRARVVQAEINDDRVERVICVRDWWA